MNDFQWLETLLLDALVQDGKEQIAWRVMDVMKAAQAFQKPVHRGMGDVEAECLERLNKAFAALQAAQKKGGRNC